MYFENTPESESFEWLDTDNGEIMLERGNELYDVEDYEAAFECYQKSAEEGNSDAVAKLAWMYVTGRGVEKDGVKSFELNQKAAELGSRMGKTNLAIAYRDAADVVEQDLEKAFQLLKESAEEGHSNGQWNLATMYRKGLGTDIDYDKSFYWIKQIAEREVFAGAVYDLAEHYEEGLGTKKDEIKANFYYALAHALDGDAECQSDIGFAYLVGQLVSQDYDKALKWLSKAAEQGNPNAQSNLGYLYAEGVGVQSDTSIAIDWYLKAAESGNAIAQNNLATYYYRGEGVEQSFDEAVYWYKKAADQGDPDAQLALGNAYALGLGIEKNSEKALKLYEAAAKGGLKQGKQSIKLLKKGGFEEDSFNNLGGCFETGEQGFEINLTKAADMYQRSAELGSDMAQCNLGSLYARGDGVERSDEKAVYWWSEAAKSRNKIAKQLLGLANKKATNPYGSKTTLRDYMNNFELFELADSGKNNSGIAQCDLGNRYYVGEGVDENIELGIYWWTRAADNGDIIAQQNLANSYLSGEGVPVNYQKAIELNERAAAQGDDFAMLGLAKIYREGLGVDSDPAKALEWTLKAAQLGSVDGQYNAGMFYENGEGTPHNITEALKWYKLAAAQGDGDANSKVMELNHINMIWEEAQHRITTGRPTPGSARMIGNINDENVVRRILGQKEISLEESDDIWDSKEN
ncbi:MAG: sel1 repeat family protein [Lactobacillales bacterium]|nr:sel1 repeat family protein [Lactobacillales bacterium]